MPAWGEGVFAVLSGGLGKVGTCWGQAQAWGAGVRAELEWLSWQQMDASAT